MSEVINFYSLKEPFGFFSNFSIHPITLKNQTWPTSEHYFQAQKFEGTKFEAAVRRCETPREAAEMGRDRSLPLRTDWLQVRDDVMRDAVYAKFSQHHNLQTQLLSTGDAILVEHTTNDSYWGDGGDGSGQNMLGKILMEVRARLVAEINEEENKESENKQKLDKLLLEFEALVAKVKPQIEAELELARRALARAEKLSDDSGVPFSSEVYVWTENVYMPASFSKMYQEMENLDLDGNEDFCYSLETIIGCYPNHSQPGWESDGWSSSSLTC